MDLSFLKLPVAMVFLLQIQPRSSRYTMAVARIVAKQFATSRYGNQKVQDMRSKPPACTSRPKADPAGSGACRREAKVAQKYLKP